MSSLLFFDIIKYGMRYRKFQSKITVDKNEKYGHCITLLNAAIYTYLKAGTSTVASSSLILTTPYALIFNELQSKNYVAENSTMWLLLLHFITFFQIFFDLWFTSGSSCASGKSQSLRKPFLLVRDSNEKKFTIMLGQKKFILILEMHRNIIWWIQFCRMRATKQSHLFPK